MKFFEVVVEVCVFSCFYRGACNDIAASVYDAEYGVCAAYVDAENVRFHVCIGF